MRIFLSVCCLVASSFGTISAESVTTSAAGELSGKITDLSATSVSVNGPIDASDIKFIVDKLDNLENLDLSQANIAALTSNTAYFGDVYNYEADQLPAYSFFCKKYKSLVLPQTLKYIGKGAVSGCTELTDVVLPASLDSIGSFAFSGCNGLTAVNFNSNIKKVGDYAFSRCEGLTNVDLTTLSSDAVLGAKIFANCTSVTSATLNPQMKILAAGTFEGCSKLANVVVGDGSLLQGIGEEAFMQTAITNFDFAKCPKLNVIGRWAFANVPLTKVVVPATVYSLGEGAFFYNEDLASVELPSTVTSISDFAMAGTSTMNSLVIPEGVDSIGRYAFSDASNIQTVTVPSTAEYIGTRAFENLTGMKEITSNASVPPALGDSVFAGIDQPAVPLNIEKEVSIYQAYKAADQWKEFYLEEVTNVINAATQSNIKAYFNGTTLNVKSSNEIETIRLFDANGILLVATSPMESEASIDTEGLGGNFYIVTVTTANKESKTFKLIRK